MEESDPQVCGLCRKSFGDPLTLERHLQTHSGQKLSVENPRPGANIDLTSPVPWFPGAKFQPAVCGDCGYEWIQPVCDAFPLNGPDPFACPECNSKYRVRAREPNEDEAAWLKKVPLAFMANHLRVIVATQKAQRGIRFAQ